MAVATEWMTFNDAAEHVRVGSRTVRRLVKDGILQAHGVGVGLKSVARSSMHTSERTSAVLATRARVEELSQGLSIEVIARTTGQRGIASRRSSAPAPPDPSGVRYRYRKLKEDADIAGRYRDGESAKDIAHALGVSVTLIFEELKRHNVALRGRTDPMGADLRRRAHPGVPAKGVRRQEARDVGDRSRGRVFGGDRPELDAAARDSSEAYQRAPPCVQVPARAPGRRRSRADDCGGRLSRGRVLEDRVEAGTSTRGTELSESARADPRIP